MNQEKLEEKKQIIFDFINSEQYEPLKFKEIAMVLQVPKNEKDELRTTLESLILDGKITIDNKGKYNILESNMKVGTFLGTKKDFGFVNVEGEPEDIFIPANGTKGAMHGDTVQIKIEKEHTGRRTEGEVLSILARNYSTIVGMFEKSNHYGFVIPDNQKFSKDIFISKEHTKGAVTGHKVVVDIIDYGDAQKNPEGKVTKILGHINDPGVDILSVIMANNLPLEFPEEVIHQLEDIPEEVNEKEWAGRMDIRHLQTVTIDGEDAKDLDDAVTISKKDNIYTLGVHIADVTNYVTEGSPLDVQALKRGTSVYLVDRVIPMLPHKLSNGICSLNAGEDRLALSCFMEIDEKGNVIGHKIAESIINVDQRMSYTSVQKILDQDETERKKYEAFISMFEEMLELATILRKKRRKRGSIDFDFPESQITLDKRGKPIEIKAYERNKATKIIEDFMLIANETVAEDFFWQEIPFLYRSHEAPDPEKMEALGIFINNFGYTIKLGQDDIHPKELQKLLGKIEGTPEEPLISRLTLRSMKQAKYTTSCEGHFGLSTRYYCHFTSPIRRYPDLQIHRIIKENLRGGMNEKRRKHYDKILNNVARQCSITERRAEDGEREVEKLKKVEYMQQFIGETFEGVISGITSWGMYVELPNTVEGMIRIADLTDDYYVYNEADYTLLGEHTRKTYKLGQKVKVIVVRADKLLRTIDFYLSDL